MSNLFLIVLLYIVEAKKGCKKKSLNTLSLAAYLLKMVLSKLIEKDASLYLVLPLLGIELTK